MKLTPKQIIAKAIEFLENAKSDNKIVYFFEKPIDRRIIIHYKKDIDLETNA